MKKILSLVLAIMMVLSMANVAFAAPEDVTDKNQIKAVDALISLGIVKGYDDGSYKPEKTVTRAELAKMLVEALGQGDLVAGSESSFKDSKGKWYDGYVALAAGLELVTGYPDGTFKGDNSVSYQEAVVMILRALGHTNSTVNGGVDAYNATKYKTLAQTLGILTNVTFAAGGANRGDIASMIYNSLEIERVEKTEKGLAQKIVIDKEMRPVAGDGTAGNPYLYKEFPVYETLLDKLTTRTEITVNPSHLDSTNKAYKGNMVDLEPYMYQTLVVYQNADKHVMFIKSNKTATVKGTVTTIGMTDIQWNYDNNSERVFVRKADKTIERVLLNVTPGNTIKVYHNGGESNYEIKDFQKAWNSTHDNNGVDGALGTFNGAEVTLVLNSDGKAVSAIARISDDSVQIKQAYKTGSTKLGDLNLPKTVTGKVDLTKVIVKGEVTAIEDIVAKDVVTAYYATGDMSVNATKVELVVCRDIIEGKVTKKDASGYSVINGEAYGSYVSLKLGDEGKFYLDADGDIVAFEGKSMSNSNYAFITHLNPGVTGGSPVILLRDASIRLLNKDNVAKTYNFASTAQFVLTDKDGVAAAAKNVFSDKAFNTFDAGFGGFRNNAYIVTGFNVNEDGKITLIGVQELDTVNFNAGSKTFAAADDVVIFSAYNDPTISTPAANTFKVAKVEDLDKVNPKTYYAKLNDKGEFELIIAHEQLVDNSSYAIITSVEQEFTANGTIRRVTAYVKGEKVEYLTAVNVTIGGTSGGKLFRLPLSNGVISENIAAGNAVVTGGKIAVTTVVTTNSAISINDRRLSKGATIYVFTESTSTANSFPFTRVGDESDLTLTNADFTFYNLNTDKEGYDVVIIKIKR